MGVIRESKECEKHPSTPFYSADAPLNARILLDDINEVIVFLSLLPAFDEVIEHITYDEYDKLQIAGTMGSYAGNELKRRIL